MKKQRPKIPKRRRVGRGTWRGKGGMTKKQGSEEGREQYTGTSTKTEMGGVREVSGEEEEGGRRRRGEGAGVPTGGGGYAGRRRTRRAAGVATGVSAAAAAPHGGGGGVARGRRRWSHRPHHGWAGGRGRPAGRCGYPHRRGRGGLGGSLSTRGWLLPWAQRRLAGRRVANDGGWARQRRRQLWGERRLWRQRRGGRLRRRGYLGPRRRHHSRGSVGGGGRRGRRLVWRRCWPLWQRPPLGWPTCPPPLPPSGYG